jgi:LysR family hydrogen peroxide-inducible transcriptional activator
MISTRQLRYLDAIARLGHFGRAATACAVTQPALSMQIADLERQLGVTLVERRSKGIVLTEAGADIANRAARVLRELRDMADAAAARRAPLSAPIRLGVIPTIAPYVLPRLLVDLQAAHPDLALRLRETQTGSLLAELRQGTLDVLLLALPIEDPDIETLALREDRFLLAVPPGRSFPSRLRVLPDLIRGERLLLLEEGHCLREQALAVCDLVPTGGAETFGASSLATLVQMVAAGLGLTLLPQISLAQETAHADVRLLRFADPEPTRSLGLAWRRTSPRRADFEALGHWVARALETAGGAKRSPDGVARTLKPVRS